jgi:hypothetical protein
MRFKRTSRGDVSSLVSNAQARQADTSRKPSRDEGAGVSSANLRSRWGPSGARGVRLIHIRWRVESPVWPSGLSSGSPSRSVRGSGFLGRDKPPHNGGRRPATAGCSRVGRADTRGAPLSPCGAPHAPIRRLRSPRVAARVLARSGCEQIEGVKGPSVAQASLVSSSSGRWASSGRRLERGWTAL